MLVGELVLRARALWSPEHASRAIAVTLATSGMLGGGNGYNYYRPKKRVVVVVVKSNVSRESS